MKNKLEEQTQLITELNEVLSKKDMDKLFKITKLEAEINIEKVAKLLKK